MLREANLHYGAVGDIILAAATALGASAQWDNSHYKQDPTTWGATLCLDAAEMIVSYLSATAQRFVVATARMIARAKGGPTGCEGRRSRAAGADRLTSGSNRWNRADSAAAGVVAAATGRV
jgi:hypothetical protein